MIFPFSMTSKELDIFKFYDFSGLYGKTPAFPGFKFLKVKFHDSPGFPITVATLTKVCL